VASWSENELIFKQSITDLICNIVYFYKGGINYNDLINMNIDDLEMIIFSQNKIVKAQQNVI